MDKETRIRDFIAEVKSKPQRHWLFDTAASVYFSETWKALFGQDLCSTCVNKISAAYEQLLSITETQIFTMSNQNKYKLKNDNDLIDLSFNPIKGAPTHVSKANLTDEIAEKLIAAVPALAKRFVQREADPYGDAAPATASAPVTPELPEGTPPPIVEAATLEALTNDHTKAQLIEKLTAAGIQHDPKANKETLASLLFESTKQPQ